MCSVCCVTVHGGQKATLWSWFLLPSSRGSRSYLGHPAYAASAFTSPGHLILPLKCTTLLACGHMGKPQKLEGNGVNNKKAHPSLLSHRNKQGSVAAGGHLPGYCCCCGDEVSDTHGSFLTKYSLNPSFLPHLSSVESQLSTTHHFPWPDF